MDNKSTDTAAQQPVKADARQHHKITITAFIVTVLAWVTMPLHYVVSLCLCVIGLALAIIGVRQRHGGSRNLAIVTTVAAGVLLLVYAVFWAAMLFITLNY